jgi:GGDEF domain-containing protein
VLGYSAGDTVLNTIGHRLRQHLPEDAISARLGGVEIAILRVINRADWAAVERDTRALIAALSAPITISTVPLQVELSAGVAIGGEHASTPAGPRLSSSTRRCTLPGSSTWRWRRICCRRSGGTSLSPGTSQRLIH